MLGTFTNRKTNLFLYTIKRLLPMKKVDDITKLASYNFRRLTDDETIFRGRKNIF